MPSSATTSLSVGGHASGGVVDYSDCAVHTDFTRAPTNLALPDRLGLPCSVDGGGLAGLSSELLTSSGNPDFMVASNSATGVGRRPSCLCIYRTPTASQSNWQH